MVNKFLVFHKEKIFIPRSKNPAFAEEPRYGGHGKEELRGRNRVKGQPHATEPWVLLRELEAGLAGWVVNKVLPLLPHRPWPVTKPLPLANLAPFLRRRRTGYGGQVRENILLLC